MARSDKLYDKSPKIERDGDGKVGIMKPTKADAVDAGIDGMKVPVEHLAEMYDRHSSEHRSMTRRHLKEVKGHFAKMSGKDMPEAADDIEKEEA